MVWVVFAIVLGLIAVGSMILGQKLQESKHRSLSYGPQKALTHAPIVAQGRLIWDPSPGLKQAYGVTLQKQGLQLTGRYQSEFGLGPLRTRGEIFLSRLGDRIEGRYPNGSTVNTVKGQLSDRSASVTGGLELSGAFWEKARDTLTVEVQDQQVIFTYSNKFNDSSYLRINDRQLTGALVHPDGRLQVSIQYRNIEPSLLVLSILLMGGNLLFLHRD